MNRKLISASLALTFVAPTLIAGMIALLAPASATVTHGPAVSAFQCPSWIGSCRRADGASVQG